MGGNPGSLLHALVGVYRGVVHDPIVRALATLDVSIPPMLIDVVLVPFFYMASLIRIGTYLDRRIEEQQLIRKLVGLGATHDEASQLTHRFRSLDGDTDKLTELQARQYNDLLIVLRRLGLSRMGFRGLYDRYLRPLGTYKRDEKRARVAKWLFIVISSLALLVLAMLSVEAAALPKP